MIVIILQVLLFYYEMEYAPLQRPTNPLVAPLRTPCYPTTPHHRTLQHSHYKL